MHPSGKLVALRDYEPKERSIVLDPFTGKTIRLGQSSHAIFSPPDKYWWGREDGGLSLYCSGEERPLVTLGVGSQSHSGWSVFDTAEQRVLSGHVDGSVNICDIEEVRRRLTDLGLGW